MAVPVHVYATENEHYKEIIEEDFVTLIQRNVKLSNQLSFAPRLSELVFS